MKEPVIYTPIYNDLVALKANVEKMGKNEHNFKRIVIDGRFIGFPQINGSDFSTDGLQEFCEEVGIEYYAMAPCYEQQKFNFACQILTEQERNVMILLGSDESLMTSEYTIPSINARINSSNTPFALKLNISELNPGHKYVQAEKTLPKVFINVDMMEARYLHWAIYKKGTNQLLKALPLAVPGTVLIHDNESRPEERDDLMTEYQGDNIKRESKFHKIIDRDRIVG